MKTPREESRVRAVLRGGDFALFSSFLRISQRTNDLARSSVNRPGFRTFLNPRRSISTKLGVENP